MENAHKPVMLNRDPKVLLRLPSSTFDALADFLLAAELSEDRTRLQLNLYERTTQWVI